MSDPAKPPVRVRIAPSPTGDPHVGTAYIGLFDYVFAKAHGGKFVLRIEDTDRERSNPESERQIIQSLRWLGLEWDEGPDIGGPYGPYRQSERAEIYSKHARELVEKGAAYYCFCTPERLAALREEQRARKQFVGYDGACKRLSERETREKLAAGMTHVVRLAVPKEGETRIRDLVRGEVVFQNAGIDDQVLIKSDGFPTYHLANVVDDHLMEISHVIRAEEWISSTPKHLLLYEAFGWAPPIFVHMPLLRNKDRGKISKRKNPTSLLWYKERGYLPEALRNFLALMGWSLPDGREVFTLEEMVADFRLEELLTAEMLNAGEQGSGSGSGGISAGAPVFDLEKLDWLNGVYIREMPIPEIVRRVRETIPAAQALDATAMEKAMPLVQERMKTLADFVPKTEFLFTEEVHPSAEELIPKKTSRADAIRILDAARETLKPSGDWRADALEQQCRTLVEALNLKTGSVFMCLRVAVTGTRVSPPLFESMEALGRERTLARIAAAHALLRSEA